MRLNNRQWNVTKNNLFFRNKSETNTHTAVFIYLFIIHLLVVLFITVVVAFAFSSLLFAIGVFGSIQRTFSFV